MYARIAPFDASFDVFWYWYVVPNHIEHIQKGMVVLVPWWKKEVLGLVMEMVDTVWEKKQIKEIFHVYDETLLLPEISLQLIDWMVRHYFAKIHTTARLFFTTDMLSKMKKSTFFLASPEEKSQYMWSMSAMLTDEQRRVYERIVSEKEKNFLLYGVTGSGKTEIYMHLMAYYLNLWKQVLFLVPEIILTSQLLDRTKQVFGDEVVSIHSDITPAKKTKIWQSVYHGQAKIIIGTRSSLFYPYRDLWLIIVDEDQDTSYISDTSPRYDTIEVAEKISELSGIQLLLASGTPKISHMYDGVQGKYEVLYLLEVYGGEKDS